MSLELSLLTLLHILVFAYWLGGDLGAFYTSRFLVQPGVSIEKRMMAAKIVGDVDMAPRTALVLAFPTGLLLARQSGYISLPWVVIWGLVFVFAAWLALAWYGHLEHGKAPGWTGPVDLTLRWLTLVGLVGASVAAFTGHLPWPLFLAIKCLLLAATILLGLIIRRVLVPLGPALMGLSGPSAEEAQADLAKVMGRARPLVLCIWACLLAAALTGLWKPA